MWRRVTSFRQDQQLLVSSGQIGCNAHCPVSREVCKTPDCPLLDWLAFQSKQLGGTMLFKVSHNMTIGKDQHLEGRMSYVVQLMTCSTFF